MARTSRDPFSPLVPMKKKKNVKKAVVPAVVPAALGTQKKKTTAPASAAKQNLDLLSNLEDESIFLRKPPPEDMPSYIPYSKRNAPCSTRATAPQPPTLLYLPLLTQVPDEDDCNPLDHNSPHKDPPGGFVEKAARAADPSDAIDDDDDDDEEEHISVGSFNDLVGRRLLVSMTLAILLMTMMRTKMTEWMRKLAGLSTQTAKRTALVVVRPTRFLVGPCHLPTME